MSIMIKNVFSKTTSFS